MDILTVAEFIEKYDCCPKCGGSFGVYTKVRSQGQWNDITRYDGQKENTEMMDTFSDTWESTFIYCSECHKPVARRTPLKD